MTQFLRLASYAAIVACCLGIALSFASTADSDNSKAVDHLQTSFILAIVAGVASVATDVSNRR